MSYATRCIQTQVFSPPQIEEPDIKESRTFSGGLKFEIINNCGKGPI